MRELTTHHDGHGLAENLRIQADDLGPGGASHSYTVTFRDRVGVCAHVQFQKGPRGVETSTPGVIDSVLLAIVLDRLDCFQNGPFPSDEGAEALEFVVQAMGRLMARADARAARGVLGKAEK